MASDSLSEALDAVEAALDAIENTGADTVFAETGVALAESINAFNAAAKEALR